MKAILPTCLKLSHTYESHVCKLPNPDITYYKLINNKLTYHIMT